MTRRVRLVIEGALDDAADWTDALAAVCVAVGDLLDDFTVDVDDIRDVPFDVDEANDADARLAAEMERRMIADEEAIEGDPHDVESNPRVEPWPAERWHDRDYL